MSEQSKTNIVRKYQGKNPVIASAVKIDLETEGLSYTKWGGPQYGKQGDWLVCKLGDTYTIDVDSFDATYKKVGVGQYVKVAPVWAYEAMENGSVSTKEGDSQYSKGSYIVSNDPNFNDAYPIGGEKFLRMYEVCEGSAD